MLAVAQAGSYHAGAISPGKARSSTGARRTAGSAWPPAERATGLRDTVPVGKARLPMTAGVGRPGAAGLGGGPSGCTGGCAAPGFSAASPGPGTQARLGGQRGRTRGPGVASVSAPVRGQGGKVIAAVSVVGPHRAADPLPGPACTPNAVVTAGDRISAALRRAS